jgi:hypothetical protein
MAGLGQLDTMFKVIQQFPIYLQLYFFFYVHYLSQECAPL